MTQILQVMKKLIDVIMTGLLPFEVHVLIVRILALKDCIAYMQVCTVTHMMMRFIMCMPTERS